MNKDEKAEHLIEELEDEQKDKKPNKASLLIDLAFNAGIEVYLDEFGEPYVTLPDQPIAAFPIASRSFKRWFAATCYKQKKISFSSETFSQVVNSLEGRAMAENNKKTLHTRVAKVGNTVYYDLGDGKNIVKIIPGSYKVTTQCPVRFHRFPHQQIQLLPEHGGSPEDLLKYFNLSKDYEKVLLLTYIVTILVPTIPRVALIITGEQGAAKSTGLEIIRRLIDPSEAALLSPPRKDPTSLFETAYQHYCFFLDNLSYINDDISDALCRLVTGGSMSKRMHYENIEQIVIKLKIAVGITGINLVANRADLLDRSLILHFERISNEKRMDEDTLWTRFEQDRPKILGFIFKTLAGALEIYPSVNLLADTPRMADYARYASACAIAMEYSQKDFLNAFQKNTDQQNQAALESSPTALALIKFFEGKPAWEGSVTELHTELLQVAERDNLIGYGSGSFPRSANHLWSRIMVVRPNLMAAGIIATHSQTSKYSAISLRRITQISGQETVADVATLATIAKEVFKVPENPSTNEELPF